MEVTALGPARTGVVRIRRDAAEVRPGPGFRQDAAIAVVRIRPCPRVVRRDRRVGDRLCQRIPAAVVGERRLSYGRPGRAAAAIHGNQGRDAEARIPLRRNGASARGPIGFGAGSLQSPDVIVHIVRHVAVIVGAAAEEAGRVVGARQWLGTGRTLGSADPRDLLRIAVTPVRKRAIRSQGIGDRDALERAIDEGDGIGAAGFRSARRTPLGVVAPRRILSAVLVDLRGHGVGEARVTVLVTASRTVGVCDRRESIRAVESVVDDIRARVRDRDEAAVRIIAEGHLVPEAVDHRAQAVGAVVSERLYDRRASGDGQQLAARVVALKVVVFVGEMEARPGLL